MTPFILKFQARITTATPPEEIKSGISDEFDFAEVLSIDLSEVLEVVSESGGIMTYLATVTIRGWDIEQRMQLQQLIEDKWEIVGPVMATYDDPIKQPPSLGAA